MPVRAADLNAPPFPVDGLVLDDPGASQAGVHLTIREGFGLTRIMPFRGQAAAASGALAPWWNGPLPGAGKAEWSGDSGLAWAGANCWLLIRPRQATPETGAIATALQDLAAVTDASDGLLPLDLSGPDLERLLAKGCSLDPKQRIAGLSAPTQMAHTRVLLIQLDPSTCRLLIPASHVQGFWQWLVEASAEFGLGWRRCTGDMSRRRKRLAQAV